MNKIIREYQLLFADKMWRSVLVIWSFRQFAFGLMAVYSPLYFYSVTGNLGFVLLLLAVQSTFNGITRLPYALSITRRRNVRPFFALSLLLLGLVYVGFVAFNEYPLVVIALAAVEGVLLAIVTSSYVYLFSASQKKRDIGTQVGLQYDASSLSAITAILIGGLIAGFFGLQYNFLLAAIFLAFASILVLRLKVTWPKHAKNIKYKKISLKTHWPVYVSGVANMVDYAITAVVWPLTLVVINYFTYKNIGLVLALGLTLSLVINLIIGKLSDDIDRARLVLDGAIAGTLLVYILRLISIFSLPGAFLLTIVGIITRGLFEVSYSVLFYRQIKKSSNKMLFIAEFESFSSFGLATFLLALAFIHYLGVNDTLTLFSAMLIGSFIIILARLISPDHLEEV